jgi:hypothetical protein
LARFFLPATAVFAAFTDSAELMAAVAETAAACAVGVDAGTASALSATVRAMQKVLRVMVFPLSALWAGSLI